MIGSGSSVTRASQWLIETRMQVVIVIISTSDYERDIEFGRAREVQHYLIKPIQVDNIMETFTAIRSFKMILGNAAT